VQFRELGTSELDAAYELLQTLRIDLYPDAFAAFINTHSPHTYRPLGAYERDILSIYCGVGIHENLELGRYLIIDDLVSREGAEHHVSEMIAFLTDYAKIHNCASIFLWGEQKGAKIGDLKGFRPKRDGFIKRV
jgi:hypothetical protein